MVLLHGLMGGLSNFDKMINFFSDKGYRVLVPQLPIYDLPILNTNLASIAKFVAKFITEVVGKPVTIVGNSMGGHIGLILTTTRPELVRNLVLTGSSGLYERTFGDSFPRKSDKEYIKKGLLYYGIIFFFVIGAVIGNACVEMFAEKALLIASAILAVAFVMMFVDGEKEQCK